MVFMSTGQIARKFDADRDRVIYLIRKNNIPSMGFVGNARAFSSDAVEKVGELLQKKRVAV